MNANAKEFEGKNEVRMKDIIKNIDKKVKKRETKIVSNKTIDSNEWESF